MDKYKFCISIPVHKNPETVIDQIENIQHFYKNEVAIVLHVQESFQFTSKLKDESFLNREGVYVNPEKLHVIWGTLMHVHNSNFKFAESKIDFDYFILHASNDMYVRHGAPEYVEKAKNGIHQAVWRNSIRYLNIEASGKKSWSKERHLDPEFELLLGALDINTVYGSHSEGAFFEKEVFSQMVKTIDRYYNYDGKERIYPREEYWYSTLIQKFVPNNKIATPLLFSENWLRNGTKIDSKIIKRLHNGELVDDIVKLKNPYDYHNLYAVKRVNRNINHPDRVLIRKLWKQE